MPKKDLVKLSNHKLATGRIDKLCNSDKDTVKKVDLFDIRDELMTAEEIAELMDDNIYYLVRHEDCLGEHNVTFFKSEHELGVGVAKEIEYEMKDMFSYGFFGDFIKENEGHTDKIYFSNDWTGHDRDVLICWGKVEIK